MHYNALKRKSDSVSSEIVNVSREEDEHGIRIRESWRLLLSETDKSGATRGTIDEVRTSAEEISRREQSACMGSLRGNRESERTLSDDSAPSGGENGRAGSPDGEGREHQRGTQSERPDAVGTEDEQHPPQSRGYSLK